VKLLDNGMVELVAGDLRHTMPGMPCVADGYITTFLYADDEAIGVFEQEWGTKFHRYRAAYERGENDGYYREVNFFCCLSITAHLRDWQIYTARRVFELIPECKKIYREHDAIWFEGPAGLMYSFVVQSTRTVMGLSLPDLWPGLPDDQANISSEEVEIDPISER